MTGITDIGANAAQNSESNDTSSDDNDEYNFERYDLNGVSFGKQHPTTAVRMEAVALRRLYSEDDPDRPDVAVIGRNPSLVTSDANLQSSVVMQSSDESDQFKVVNLEDSETAAVGPSGKEEFVGLSDDGETVEIYETEMVEIEVEDDGEVETEEQEVIATDDDGNPLIAETMDRSSFMLVEFGSNSTFHGDMEHDFGLHDHIALKRGGGAGRSITTTLDVAGARGARTETDEDGEIVLHDGGFPQHNGGFLEYPGEDRDVPPRHSRDPELRPDVEGHDVIIMLQRLSEIDSDYNGRAYWATVFASLEDERMQELAEQYAEDEEDRTADDFLVQLDGDEFVKLQPTDEFEPSEDLLVETGYIAWDENRPSPSEINEKRVEEGFDEYDFDSTDDGSDGTEEEGDQASPTSPSASS